MWRSTSARTRRPEPEGRRATVARALRDERLVVRPAGIPGRADPAARRGRHPAHLPRRPGVRGQPGRHHRALARPERRRARPTTLADALLDDGASSGAPATAASWPGSTTTWPTTRRRCAPARPGWPRRGWPWSWRDAHRRTGDPRYAEGALGALEALTVDVDQGGVRSMVSVDPSQTPMPWYVERAYPGESPWKGAALNGFMVSITNLRATAALLRGCPAADAVGRPAAAARLAAELADQGAATLARHLPDHDTGSWSLLRPAHPRTPVAHLPRRPQLPLLPRAPARPARRRLPRHGLRASGCHVAGVRRRRGRRVPGALTARQARRTDRSDVGRHSRAAARRGDAVGVQRVADRLEGHALGRGARGCARPRRAAWTTDGRAGP